MVRMRRTFDLPKNTFPIRPALLNDIIVEGKPLRRRFDEQLCNADKSQLLLALYVCGGKYGGRGKD